MRDFGGAEKARDRRLRKKLLFCLYELARNSPTGFLLGRRLADSAESLMPPGQCFENDRHALNLLRDLVAAGFAKEQPRGLRRKGDEFTVDHCEFAITDEGTALQLEERKPHALVEDDRVAEGE